MGEEDRWVKVRQIVREECERIRDEILEVIAKNQKTKIGFLNGKWTGITQEQLEAWKAAYGAVDVDGELKKLAAWIVSNPHKSPKSQFARFINGCLAREQNRAAIRSIPTLNEEKVRTCAYCGVPALAMVNGYWHCREHSEAAMESRIPMMRMVK